MTALPDGFFHCQWCRGGVRFASGPLGERVLPDRCPHCQMHPGPVIGTLGGKDDPEKTKRSGGNRRTAPRAKPLSTQPMGQPVLGIDPGYRYTGVVVRDGDVVLHATTLVRAKDEKDPFAWAATIAEACREVHQEHPAAQVGIEGVTAPKGFKGGQHASLNPGAIVYTGVVAGYLAATFLDGVIVPPGGNGSQHLTHYPPSLVGRRPADLPGSTNGAGTRDHEQSAYDVAGKAARLFYPAPKVRLAGLSG